MKQYISKSALVSELEKRIEETKSMQPKFDQFWAGQISAFKGVLKILNTLEVKELNLEEELDEWIKYGPHTDYPWCTIPDAIKITAEHFYELGLKAQKGETELLKVKGYLVRDKDDYTAIYAEKPHRGKTEWVDSNVSCLMTINDARLVSDIEFEDEPVEVEVIIKAQKGE